MFHESNYIFKISRLRALKLYVICSYFKSLKFFRTPTLEPFGVISRNLLIRSRNQNIFEKFKPNRNLRTIPFKMMYNMSMLRHRFSNERGGGGGAPWTTFLSYSVKVCVTGWLIAGHACWRPYQVTTSERGRIYRPTFFSFQTVYSRKFQITVDKICPKLWLAVWRSYN